MRPARARTRDRMVNPVTCIRCVSGPRQRLARAPHESESIELHFFELQHVQARGHFGRAHDSFAQRLIEL